MSALDNPPVTTSELHTYDAATNPRGILRHLAPLLGYPGVIAGNTTLLANFFRRDLLGRFRGSFLGLFWVLVQPIFLFAIYFMVFGFLFAPKGQTGSASVEFAIYLFGGIIAFSSFSESTTRSCNSIIENGNLVKKVRFPCELLPVSNILVSMIVYAVGAMVMLAVGLSLDQITLSTTMLALPLVGLVHFVMCLGVGLLLATLQVLIRDTIHLYTIFQQAWFFLSPVFWPYSMIQGKLLDNGLGLWSWLIEINPLYGLVQAHRLALGFGLDHDQMKRFVVSPTGEYVPLPDGGFATESLPGLGYHLGLCSVWALVFLLFGYGFFMSRKNKFSDLV